MYIQVEIYTTDFLVTGNLNTPGERMSDILNIKNESAVIINDAQMTRLLAMGKTPPSKFIEARIEKRHILFACPTAQDITQKSLFRKSFRQMYDVQVLVGDFDVIGTIHLTQKLDISTMFLQRQDDFIPLTNATATYALYPSLNFLRETLVFNKNQVSFLAERLRKEDVFKSQPSARAHS
jgi:hypothetical protein